MINIVETDGAVKTENGKLEKDLPTLREIVGSTWKKEEELKAFKSEVAALERKIQLTLTPYEQVIVDFEKEKEGYLARTIPNVLNTEQQSIRTKLPQTHSPSTDKKTSDNFIVERIIFGHSGIQTQR